VPEQWPDIGGATILGCAPDLGKVELGTIGLTLFVLHGGPPLLAATPISRIGFGTSSSLPEYGFAEVAALFRGRSGESGGAPNWHRLRIRKRRLPSRC
jgi:hypothetical protein